MKRVLLILSVVALTAFGTSKVEVTNQAKKIINIKATSFSKALATKVSLNRKIELLPIYSLQFYKKKKSLYKLPIIPQIEDLTSLKFIQKPNYIQKEKFYLYPNPTDKAKQYFKLLALYKEKGISVTRIKVPKENNSSEQDEDEITSAELNPEDIAKYCNLSTEFLANADSVNKFRANIIRIAQNYVGVKYRWGGATPKSFDCSGFTYYLYNLCGIKISRIASEQAALGRFVSVDECKAGDLAFFGSRRGNKSVITHVGVVISGGGNSLFLIHASRRGGIKVEDAFAYTYFTKRFLFIKRII